MSRRNSDGRVQITSSVEDGSGSLYPRFPSPLINPCMRIARTRLSDWIHPRAHERRRSSSVKETDGCFANAPCAVQLRLKVKLFLKNPNFPVVSGQSHSPCLIFFKSAPEVRDLPSIPFPGLRRYYFPLRLPPRPAPKALLRVATPHPGRASHVAQITFLTCCPHYPGGSEQVHLTVTSLSRFGLPRILGGSASTTVLSRPAQGSLALRPVWLLQPKSLHLSPGLHQGGLPTSMPG